MLDYIRDVACITAYRADRGRVTNRKLMDLLKKDMLFGDGKITRCVSMWNRKLREVFIVHILPRPQVLRTLLNLSRKYGQDTLIYFGRVYDVASGRVLGRFTRATFYTYKPNVPYWIKITRPFHRPVYLELS